MVQGHRVVHPVSEERHVFSSATSHLYDPRLLIGADPSEYRRRQDRRFELVVVERPDLGAAEHTRAVDPDIGTHLRRHQAVVPCDDLHLYAELFELGDRGAGVGLRAVGECQEPDQCQPVLVFGAECLHTLGRAGGHGHDPGPIGEQCFQCCPSTVRDVRAPVQHYLGGALGDEKRLARGIPHQHRDQLALVVERKHALPLIASCRGGDLPASSCSSGRPQGLVQRVSPDRSLVSHRRFVAHESEQQRAIALLPVGAESPLEGDHPLGEGAGFVGEENLDVAQVLDGDQPLHQHLLCHEGPRAGREADCHDGGHHLGCDAHGNGQREEQRLDKRS